MSKGILNEYHNKVISAKNNNSEIPEFPEKLLIPNLYNTWHDTAEAVLNNWIGNVYQLTNIDRKKPFRDDIDPNDPLKLMQ